MSDIYQRLIVPELLIMHGDTTAQDITHQALREDNIKIGY